MSQVVAAFGVNEKRTNAIGAKRAIGEFGCRRLLMRPSGVILHLWRIGGRVGYLERYVCGRHRWVWLHPDSLARVRAYQGPAIAGGDPELELDEAKPNGHRKRALQQLNPRQ